MEAGFLFNSGYRPDSKCPSSCIPNAMNGVIAAEEKK